MGLTEQHATGAMNRRTLVFTRVLDASQQVVFSAWIEASLVAQWWGPCGFTTARCELDVRPGGRIRIDTTAPDGTVYPMAGKFHEITRPEQLVFTSNVLEDESGVPQLEMLNTATFVEHNRQTQLVLETRVLKATAAAVEALAGMEERWNRGLDRLAELIARIHDSGREHESRSRFARTNSAP